MVERGVDVLGCGLDYNIELFVPVATPLISYSALPLSRYPSIYTLLKISLLRILILLSLNLVFYLDMGV